ncbi:MAG: hypothetical protein QOI47_2379, partial [Actinomycetota bacterium]|nr:hypothetical protein [Actinomycetota bacterium]
MPAPLRHVRQVVADDPLATSSAKSSRTASSRPEPDWAAQTADSIERVVGGIRSKTLDPLDRIVRVVVYGLLAAVLGVTALVLLTAALVRAVDVAIPGDVWSV